MVDYGQSKLLIDMGAEERQGATQCHLVIMRLRLTPQQPATGFIRIPLPKIALYGQKLAKRDSKVDLRYPGRVEVQTLSKGNDCLPLLRSDCGRLIWKARRVNDMRACATALVSRIVPSQRRPYAETRGNYAG